MHSPFSKSTLPMGLVIVLTLSACQPALTSVPVAIESPSSSLPALPGLPATPTATPTPARTASSRTVPLPAKGS